MQFSDTDLVAFRVRCIQAAQQGFLIARADEYIETLEQETTVDLPADVEKGSAAHLADLATAVLEERAGGKKRAAVKKSTPKQEAALPKKDPELIVPVSYDGWSPEELQAEAQKRQLPNCDKMGKAELAAVLEANDAELLK